MGSASSPNDPGFFVRHCSVDRIWEVWMNLNRRNVLPDGSAVASLYLGHRIDDSLAAPFSDGVTRDTPCKVLNVSNIYAYGSLPA